jgi:transglutaminase-like putative cysteine protease
VHYLIRHVTRFRYSDPITESVMEVRMQPRTEGTQRCLRFELRTNPRAVIATFQDDLRNHVHAFDIPDRHTHLTITAEALVETAPAPPLPDALGEDGWSMLDAMTSTDEYWDMLEPSTFTEPTDLLQVLAREVHLGRTADPLTTFRDLTSAIHDAFEYDTHTTEVNSPIDQALASRHGVCQDFTHIMIALVRQLGIPCRYVSGYLYHRTEDHDRSARDATHAWVEALFPAIGWVGFDPTNDLVVGERHVRAAVGRDYADVPPTRGVFKGRADTELAVVVRVSPAEAPAPEEVDEEEEPAYRQTTELGRLPDEDLHEQPQQ